MAEDNKQQINLIINDGQEFYAHESSINFNPMVITFDFKNVTPRIDQRAQSGQPTMVLRHNVVLLDPWHVKQFHSMLGDMITRYEKEFGKIDKPKSVERFEKRQKDSAKKGKDKVVSPVSGDYIG